MFRNPISFLILILMGAVWPDLAKAQDAPFTICETVTASMQGDVDVHITVVNFTDIRAFSLTLDYDYSVVQFVQGSAGPTFPGFQIGDEQLPNGLHRLSMGWYGNGTSLPDSSTLITITFSFSSGSTALEWFDNGGSCQYMDVNYVVLNDIPFEDFYENGYVCGALASPGQITGDTLVCQGMTGVNYSVDTLAGAIGYSWTVPQGATIVDGEGTNAIMVDYSMNASSGEVTVSGNTPCGPGEISQLNVAVGVLPVANAGPDIIIPYGTSTTLHAEDGGGGSYSYHWSPEALLIDPELQDPQTVILNASTLFTVIVTDLSTLCESSDAIMVFVSGGPLSVNPSVDPDSICQGGTVQLSANAAGGSGSYSYSWSSDPPGTPPWSSTLPDPVVTPDTSTIYYVSVFDGFTYEFGSVNLYVNPAPETPEITVNGMELTSSSCCGNQWYLDGNAIQGATQQTLLVQVSGQYFDIVTLDGCSSDTSEMVDIIVGIEEIPDLIVRVYPVPAREKVCIEMRSGLDKEVHILVLDMQGQILLSRLFSGCPERLEVDLKGLCPGIYVLQMEISGRKYYRKVILN